MSLLSGNLATDVADGYIRSVMSKPRGGIRFTIDLTDRAVERIEPVLKRTGMKKVELIERLCEWFGTIPSAVTQSVILKTLPESEEPHLIAKELKRLAAERGHVGDDYSPVAEAVPTESGAKPAATPIPKEEQHARPSSRRSGGGR